jgi:hypothetical protein
MNVTSEPCSNKIRRRVACVVVATVVGVSIAPTASASSLPGGLTRPNYILAVR